MSHELKTPITIIQGTINKCMGY
ncbi:hypothetical protein [Clostridium culturomicium]|nr:hypothetical protein [Clostridium culturomicium]